jgi:hypothetical protein
VVSGVGLCSLFSNFRFGGAETGSTFERDRFAMCLRAGANVHLFIPKRPLIATMLSSDPESSCNAFQLSERWLAMCAGPHQAGASRSNGAIASPMSDLDEKNVLSRLDAKSA